MFDNLEPFLCVMVYVLVFMSSHIWTDIIPNMLLNFASVLKLRLDIHKVYVGKGLHKAHHTWVNQGNLDKRKRSFECEIDDVEQSLLELWWKL